MSMFAAITNVLDQINHSVNNYVLVVLLILTGVVCTIVLRGVQLRLFPTMARYIFRSRAGAEGGISSFQAFAIGMATRIGIGNITGVALALVLGGPGAIFWMWLVASIGGATAFAEATLAQVFKVRWHDHTFRGGPAYYLKGGFSSRTWGIVFAVPLLFAMVVSMPMVQANSIAANLTAFGITEQVTSVILMVLLAACLIFGVKGVARVAEILTPAMSLVYVAVAAIILVMNFGAIPEFITDIFRSAFGLDPALAGVSGGIMAALLNGAQRGLFSNEAGMGTSPNAAATATVRHPGHQGLIQSFGVFIDTGVVCTATAFIILATGAPLYVPGQTDPEAAGNLTSLAVQEHLGSWMGLPMGIMVFFFGFSSILGSFAYAVANADFIKPSKSRHLVMAALMTAATGYGAIEALIPVWILMDTAMAVITVVNLIGVLRNIRVVRAVVKDFEDQLADGGATEAVFAVANVPDVAGSLKDTVWTTPGAHEPAAS